MAFAGRKFLRAWILQLPIIVNSTRAIVRISTKTIGQRLLKKAEKGSCLFSGAHCKRKGSFMATEPPIIK
jgi:hypothetical protein